MFQKEILLSKYLRNNFTRRSQELQPLGTSSSPGWHVFPRQTELGLKGTYSHVTKSSPRTSLSLSVLPRQCKQLESPPKDLQQGSSGRIPVQHFTKNLVPSNIKYMSAIIILAFICSHKTLIPQPLTECRHVPGGVWLKKNSRASLVAQWLRICLPMQGTRVRALVWEDPTCRGATRPVSHNY